MLVCCFYDILFEQRIYDMIYDMIWYDMIAENYITAKYSSDVKRGQTREAEAKKIWKKYQIMINNLRLLPEKLTKFPNDYI